MHLSYRGPLYAEARSWDKAGIECCFIRRSSSSSEVEAALEWLPLSFVEEEGRSFNRYADIGSFLAVWQGYGS